MLRMENAMQNSVARQSVWIALGLVAAHAAFAQTKTAAQGIPIKHTLTLERCGGCHRADSNGIMGRISFIRTTPEIWQQAIKRMIRLNGAVATPDEVREIVKYLSNNNGLAPEELEPAVWELDP